MSQSNVALARRFVAAVEEGVSGAALGAFFHPDVEQWELPNRLFDRGVRRDFDALLASAEKGKTVLRSQKYEILDVVANEQRVAIEMRWRGELAVPLGELAPGDVLTGQFAFFLEIEDGRIRKMRNYDCYDPFSAARGPAAR